MPMGMFLSVKMVICPPSIVLLAVLLKEAAVFEMLTAQVRLVRVVIAVTQAPQTHVLLVPMFRVHAPLAMTASILRTGYVLWLNP